jgi:hypothetical protein
MIVAGQGLQRLDADVAEPAGPNGQRRRPGVSRIPAITS